MGKSLSIAAITISIYDVNGYVIVPGQPIDDDYPLHPSLEKLRSKLVYRKSPLLTPSEIKQINSRHLAMYESETMVSRKILMHTTPDKVKNAAQSFDNAWTTSDNNKDGQSKSYFVKFMEPMWIEQVNDVDEANDKENNNRFYGYLLGGNIENAKSFFKNYQLCYNDFTTMLVQYSYIVFFTDDGMNGSIERKFADENERKEQADVWFNALKEIIFEADRKGDRFNKATTTRKFDDGKFKPELQSYLYTLSFITKRIMTSVETDGASYYAVRYMWSEIQSDPFTTEIFGGSDDPDIKYFEKFGFVKYNKVFIKDYTWNFKGKDKFEQFISILMDIQNWDDPNYEFKADFKVPYFANNRIGFKAKYLVKVLNDGKYELDKNYFGADAGDIGEADAPFLEAIQRVLSEWYDNRDQ